MSAGLLREAARLMRERAEGSTAGPWMAAEQTHGEWYGLQSQWTALGNVFEKVEAEHIASWHPVVALAVADWLEQMAVCWNLYEGHAIRNTAIVTARTYLGGA